MYSSHSVANTQLETHQLIQPDEWVCALMLLLMREAACVSFPFITALDSQHHSASSPLSHSHGCKFTLLSLINTHAFALVDLHPALIVSNNITLATCVFPILIKNSSHIFRFFFWRLKILILLPIAHFCLTEQNAQMYKKKKTQALTGEGAWGRGVDTVTAIPTLTAGDLIIRLPQGRARGGGFHLLKFPLQYSTHGPLHLHLKPKDSRGATHYLISSLGLS